MLSRLEVVLELDSYVGPKSASLWGHVLCFGYFGRNGLAEIQCFCQNFRQLGCPVNFPSRSHGYWNQNGSVWRLDVSDCADVVCGSV